MCMYILSICVVISICVCQPHLTLLTIFEMNLIR